MYLEEFQSDFTRNDATMERFRLGLVLILIGVILFVITFITILLPLGLYLISLVAMFVAIVLIAIGFAYTRSNENSANSAD